MDSNLGQLDCVNIDLAFHKLNDQKTVSVVTRHIPLPPSSVPVVGLYTTPWESILLNEDQQRTKEALVTIKDPPKENEDPSEWFSRCVKRNPHVLFLHERLRPLSKMTSLAKIQKVGDKKATTENPDVLPREVILQVIHQFFHCKRYVNSAKTLEKETGIVYNGLYKYEQTPVLKTVLVMSIEDETKIEKLPKQQFDLQEDFEVQTASIYTHLDSEIDAKEAKKNIWEELSNRVELAHSVLYIKDKTATLLKAASLNRLIDL